MIRGILRGLLSVISGALILVVGALLILYVIGIRPFVVVSGSMLPTLPINSVCLVDTRVDFEDIQVGDIIIYNWQRSSSGSAERIIHRVITVTDEALETKGDANSVSDGYRTTRDNLVGKMLLCIPLLGYPAAIARTAWGKVVLVLLILIVLFGDDVVYWFLGKKRERSDREE